MMDKVVNLIGLKDYVVPSFLLMNYKKLNITSDELIFIIYLINGEACFNPKKISADMNLTLKDVMEIVNSLTSKGLISLELKKVNNLRNEYISLELLYKKLAFQLVDSNEKKENSNIFDVFEKNFGRTLSPMEYEIINTWIDSSFSEETILLALKEATYNGVRNLRYIDKILYEWEKKGIKTEEDIIKNKKNFTQKEVKQTDSFDYDWLNNE